MASTQKTNGKQETKSRTQTQKKPAPPSKKPPGPAMERIAGGVLCFLLAMFLILGAAQVDAIFIRILCNGIKGLIGYGFWLTIPALLLAAFLLLFRQWAPVTLRIWCSLLLPVFFGAWLHILLALNVYPLNLEGFFVLWTDGQLLLSGGALSGTLAVLFTQLFSSIGAGLIFVMGILLLLLAACHITPETIVKATRAARDNRRLRQQERAEYYDNLEEDDAEENVPVPLLRPFRPRKPMLDLPLDEPPSDPEAKAATKRQGFYDRNTRVKRPDEVLAQMGQEPSDTSTPIQPESPPPPMPIPAESLAEKDLTKREKQELIREHQEHVAREIVEDQKKPPQDEYKYPPLSLLHPIDTSGSGAVKEELSAIQKRLSDTILSFGIEAKIVGAVRGPSVTRYEVELEQGVRLNRLTNLSDDIALALGAASVRIAPVPGKISMVGIEVPNKVITPVWIREVLSSKDFAGHASKVSFAVGKDIGGNYIVGDISRLPHLLIAGTTGSGKSVCTNSLIISMLYKSSPDEVRLIMVDPKMVELGIYNDIPHLLIPVVTDPKKAAGALQWAVVEMMKRYRMFSEAGVRELSKYNEYAEAHEELQPLPKIVVVIDELADLMLVAAKEVEESICRVAQMGRAAGMHLIIATQRPSADVITGLMKANIPSRIAFAVASSLESRIILDTQGAEKLVGKGDMLWFPLGAGKPLRVQGCLIDDKEVASVAEFVKQSGSVSYDEAVLEEIELHTQEQGKGKGGGTASAAASGGGDEGYDELFSDAVEVVLELGQASVSMLQRRLKLGYSRAARLVDQMEDRGIVGPFEGSKPRQLLVTRESWAASQGKTIAPEVALAATGGDFEDSLPSAAPTFGEPMIDQAPPWEDEEDD